jgi:hypothetical protein
LPRLAAEQVVDGGVERFALDVPQRDVYGGDGGHGDRATAPVRSAVEILPDVFDVEGVAADETGKHVLGKIRCDGEFAAVERGVA